MSNQLYEKKIDIDRVADYVRALIDPHFLFCLHNPDGIVSENTVMIGPTADRVFSNEGLLPAILFAGNESYRLVWNNPFGSQAIMNMELEEVTEVSSSDHVCPKCGKGSLKLMVTTTTKSQMWRCSRHPECDYAHWGGSGKPFGDNFGFQWRQGGDEDDLMTGFAAEVPENGLAVPMTLILLHVYDIVNRLADMSLQSNFVFDLEGNSDIEYELKTKKIVVANSLVDMFDMIYLPRLQAQQESMRPS